MPRVAARANWGRWIVDCPKVSVHALWMDPGTDLFLCPACGAAAEVVWPSEEMVYAIERLLLMRPNEAHRSWNPGETLHDLMRENGELGLFSDIEALGASPGDVLLSVDDGGIRRDLMPIIGPEILRAVAA